MELLRYCHDYNQTFEKKSTLNKPLAVDTPLKRF